MRPLPLHRRLQSNEAMARQAMPASSNQLLWAVLSAVFAALAAIFAKIGLEGIDFDLATLARTVVIFFVLTASAVIENSRRHYDHVLGKLGPALAKETVKSQLHVVVGHRGHTAFERWLTGSVARQIIAYAHCSVAVVRK